MITFERIDINNAPWQELDVFEDRSVFQTYPWIKFIAESQAAEPLLVKIKDNEHILGYFTGLIVYKLGLKILGSPFNGWTTTYMGFNLLSDASLNEVLEAFSGYVFNDLGCRILQISERRFSDVDLDNSSYLLVNYRNLEIDLTHTEADLLSKMASAKRRGIKKAAKSGITIEEVSDIDFADDYYAQLEEVFAKRSLTPTYNKERVIALIRNLQPSGKLLLLRARNPDGVCIATGIFPAFNDTMLFWGGASWRKHQHYHPNEYLFWYAMKYWKNKGIKTFNLGGWADYKKQYGGEKIKGVILIKSNPYFLAGQLNRAKSLWKSYRKILGKITIGH
ncbi:MAG: GNAT family N-acetyltransferase [Gammaproteobacteria bacterium]|nr:GNAT family N-acetyltransferase [Gammaproteobacteria bacterium]